LPPAHNPVSAFAGLERNAHMKSAYLIGAIVCLFAFIVYSQDDEFGGFDEEPTQTDEQSFDDDFGSFDKEPPKADVQSGSEPFLSLAARIGYGFRIGGTEYLGARSVESRTLDNQGVLIESKNHYFNYGQGIKFEIAADMTIMQHLGAELAFHFTGKVPRTVIEYDSAGITVFEEKFKHASLGPKLMLVPRFRILELIDMDIGFGIGLFFTKFTAANDHQTWNINEGYIETKPGFAFVGRMGAEYPLTDRIAIVVNVSADAVSYTVKERRRSYSTTILTTEYDRSSSSNTVERPTKIPGSNVSLLLGTRFDIF
jgi:hypothetical protein